MSLRAAIRSEIADIRPFDAVEAQAIAEALTWIDSGAELCRQAKPATPPRHLVAYFLVTDDAHILLCDHRKSGLWLPTGGHVEPGEHPRDTARRECIEELGIEADFRAPEPQFITASPTVGPSPHIDVSLWYILRGDRQATLAFDREEFHGIKWFHPSDAPQTRVEPALSRLLAKRAAGRAV